MPKYIYVVKDKEGKSFKNVLDSPGYQSAVERLQKMGYFIVSLNEISFGLKSSGKQLATAKKKIKFSHQWIKLADFLSFSRQLATMIESGITLTRSLDVILSQTESAQFYAALTKVKAAVEQGSSLSAALGAQPKIFNQFWVSLVEVGEASGTLPSVLNKLAYYLEQQDHFRSTIISGIIYPAILFVVATGAVAFFAFVVGPQFEAVF